MEALRADKHPTYPISVHRPGVDRDHPSVEPVSAGKEGEAHHAPRVWHAPLEAKRSAPALRREGCCPRRGWAWGVGTDSPPSPRSVMTQCSLPEGSTERAFRYPPDAGHRRVCEWPFPPARCPQSHGRDGPVPVRDWSRYKRLVLEATLQSSRS